MDPLPSVRHAQERPSACSPAGAEAAAEVGEGADDPTADRQVATSAAVGARPVPAADRLPSRWGLVERADQVQALLSRLDARGERELGLLSAFQVPPPPLQACAPSAEPPRTAPTAASASCCSATAPGERRRRRSGCSTTAKYACPPQSTTDGA